MHFALCTVHSLLIHFLTIYLVSWKILPTSWALNPEFALFIAGAVVQWLRDGLKIIRSSSDIEKLAAEVTDNAGVYVVPAFAGLGAPYWNQHARGMITGITRSTTSGHIARAALESIAYQTKDVLKAMEADSGIAIRELRVDGGATVNNFLMQFQSDILDCTVNRPLTTETTALGAAYLAGLATGFWENREAIMNQWKSEKVFHPAISQEERESLEKGWHNAVKAAISMTQEE
jgi:glycerol kinase